jgi:hypothetical protein
MWVDYDPVAPFPQTPTFMGGVHKRAGNIYRPPATKAAFEVADSELIHGMDARFYDVTASDVLTPKAAADVQSIRDADQATEDARRTEREIAANEISSGPAPQSLPALQTRVTAIEHFLGLRSDT